MPKLIVLLTKMAKCKMLSERLLFLGVFLFFSFSFVYFETQKRILPVPKVGDNQNLGNKLASTTEPVFKIGTANKVTESKPPGLGKSGNNTELPPPDPWKLAKNYLDQSKHPVFNAFEEWIKEYETANCANPTDCLDHDPRYLRGLLLRGERLSRTRASKFLDITRGDPEMAIKMAIPAQTAEKLPPAIKKNLEKWESTFANVKTAHSCFSPDHKGCEIRRFAKFKDSRHVRLWTFGDRSGVDTIYNLAVWGVSIGDDFAMADTPLRVVKKSGKSGVAEWGGADLTFQTEAELNYFSYLLKDAERRTIRANGSKKVKYPMMMGSSNTMSSILQQRYSVVAVKKGFHHAYDDAFGSGIGATSGHPPEIPASGTLLKIESKEENDYICELVRGHVQKGYDRAHDTFVPWIWLGATDDPGQYGLVFSGAWKEIQDLGASEGQWRWLDGQDINQSYNNWVNGSIPTVGTGSPGVGSWYNHAVLNYITGEWNHTWGPFPAGPAGDPDRAEGDVGSSLPYVIEHELLPDHGRTQDLSLKGIRKVLVIPGRYRTQTETFYSSFAFTGNHLLTDEFGEPIDPDISKQPFLPITTGKLKECMDEVREYFLRTTDQELELVPVFAPTVTIPVDISTGTTFYAGSPNNHDSEGNHTGGAVYIYGPNTELYSWSEQAKRLAAQESDEYDFYGPAFVGIAGVDVNTTTGYAGDPNGYDSPPAISIQGGEFINPVTGMPHVRFEPAELEAILNEHGRITGIRVKNPGAYYFDPEFGDNDDFRGRSIFDYNYTEEDSKLAGERSPLYEHKDLCVILDSNGDGFAEYSKVKPKILINGNGAFDDNFSLQVDNICLTWLVATTYQFGQQEKGDTDDSDGIAEFNSTPSSGLAYVGAPGSHISIKTDSDGQRGISSRTVAHEIGHNLGLWHDQGYISKGELVLSDEASKVEYGNPYSVMGSGQIDTGGEFSLPGQTALNEIFGGRAGFSSGLYRGVDVLEINKSSDLDDTNLTELDALNPHTFRIYRNNFYSPPRSLRESNFTVHFPEDAENNISWFIDELLGQAGSGETAHERNQTASDRDLNLSLVVSGTGHDANVTLRFSKNNRPRLEVHDGGRGFYQEPHFRIVDPSQGTSVKIDPSWIFEENSMRSAKLIDINESAIWIRGIRISTSAAGKGLHLPRALDLDDNLSQYFLSYRTDSSMYGLNLLLANDGRGKFLPDRETFLVDCTPNTPNDFSDSALLVGSTYSDYDSDIHITPIGWGGGANLEQLESLTKQILEINQKRSQVSDVFGEGSANYSDFTTQLEELVATREKLGGNSYPYLEVVINVGTTESATAPEFDLFVDNKFPRVGEYIQLTAIPANQANSLNYAYSWFINEQPLENPQQLNNPAVFTAFNQPGRQVVRVVLSDMKGGLSSKTLILDVKGRNYQHDDSLLSGTVRSSQGLIQGARVVVEQSPYFEHYVDVEGVSRDSYLPTGLNNPFQLKIDNEISPTLEFHRGEIHRFYFSQFFGGNYKFVFMDGPENSPPRVSLNMLSDPRRSLTKFGGLYTRNPEIIYELNTSFNPYKANLIAPFHEVVNFDKASRSIANPQFITRPFAKALMEESGISKGRVGPLEMNEFGYYIYGGKGYNPKAPPLMKVQRDSIWEDLDNTNATARAVVDGVGTISPINSVFPITGLPEFMGPTWRTRNVDDILPEIIVWGTGGDGTGEDPEREVNASIVKGKEQNRYIRLLNQGQGYEPDATMAILHYPFNPYGYWTFDRHESLFEDNQSARYQPSPAWNREFFFNNMVHRWTFDEENGSTIANVDKDNNFTVTLSTGLSSDWGLLGRALEWNASQEHPQVISFLNALPDDNVTVSFWARPNNDFNITLGNNVIKLNFDSDNKAANIKTGVLDALTNDSIRENPQFNKWIHFAFTVDRRTNDFSLYIDGRANAGNQDLNLSGDLNISGFDGLLDELIVYNKSLDEPAIKYLAGRTYLDISGNKFHISPMSEGLTPVTPGQLGSSDDVPSDFSLLPEAQAAATPDGRLGRLGDTFIQENSGHSLALNGVFDYLDLSSHKDEFALPEGTISLWVKVPQSYNQELPLLWLSKPFDFTDINVTDPVSGNSTIEREFDPGQYFSLDILNGWPRIAGYQVLGNSNKVNTSGEWKHLVATFPDVRFWIDGEEVPTAPYDADGTIFNAMTNPLEFISEADSFWIGKALNTDKELTHFYQGLLDDLAIYDRALTSEEVFFLYELRRGREQIPRLEVVVDAVGTVEMLEQGDGYRENPKLVFGYENSMDKLTLAPRLTKSALESAKTESNTTHGELALVQFDDQGNLINKVYSFHMGADPASNYTYQNKWRKSGSPNGWRPFVSAQGIGEYDNAALGDVVWTKRLSTPLEILLPDQNKTMRRYVEYVTIDENFSSSSPVNQTKWSNSFFWKPNGLYGFLQVPDLNVTPPGRHNNEISDQESLFFNAEAYVLYHIDHDANESVTIVDSGSGFTSDMQNDIFDANLKISGRGYQPIRTRVHEFGYEGNDFETHKKKEQWEDPLEPLDDADPIIFDPDNFVPNQKVSVGDGSVAYDWNGTHDVGLALAEFNQSLAKVIVDNPGFGYATPVELRSWGGYPKLGIGSNLDEPVVIDNLKYSEPLLGVGYDLDDNGSVPEIDYEEAIFEVTEVDENGSITKIIMKHAGKGYRRWWDNEVFSFINPELSYEFNYMYNLPGQIYPFTQRGIINDLFPSKYSVSSDGNLSVTGLSGQSNWLVDTRPVLGYVSVVGGGGMGAEIWITGLTPDGEVEGGALDPDIVIVNGGRGYFNIDPGNYPKANLTSAQNGEVNATVFTQLGGYLNKVPVCRGCKKVDDIRTSYGDEEGTLTLVGAHQHIAPWIEIWDRGRDESRIDELGVRALASPKVVNGEIVKVVVIEGGSGYIDPVVFVRDGAPKHHYAYNYQNRERIWKCTMRRVTNEGEEKICGHVHKGLYPPEACPGETDDIFPYEDENGTVPLTGEKVENWQLRHNSRPEHQYCVSDVSLFGLTGHEHNNSNHLGALFLTRKCWGTKENYLLLNPIYRYEVEAWASLDANLSIVAHNGRITEIIVENNGSNYFAPSLLVEGSGSGVDTIPVYNESGLMIDVIFDDPRLKNVQLDTHIARPLGAGQGFRERPWAWDNSFDTSEFPRESLKIRSQTGGALAAHVPEGGWKFGTPSLKDSLGDRILSVEVNSSGVYKNTTDLTPAFIDYNTSVKIAGHGLVDLNTTDFDGDGQRDFFDAEIHGIGDFRLKKFMVDSNGTFNDWTEVGKALTPRGLFSEQPRVEIWNLSNFKGSEDVVDSIAFPFAQENELSFIRQNGRVGYDALEEKSFIELYVDDRFPAQIFYGVDGAVLPKMGGDILVSEGLPGADWAINEPSQKKHFAYTDQNGFYAIGDLEPGMYLVTVFMEDKNYQDITFRPDINTTRVSQVVYVPGFPELELVTDNFGFGRSSLVWSIDSRKLSRPSGSGSTEFDHEYRVEKKLEGIGRGFNPNAPPPQVILAPGPKNIGQARPRLNINVSVDGSLTLQIIDDENTSTFFPSDTFSVRFSSTISGVDFYKSYQFSDTNKTFGIGERASWGSQDSVARLVIFPDDGNGSNPVVAPLSNLVYEWNASSSNWTEVVRHKPFRIRAEVFEANGTRIENPSIDWRLSFDFNSSEGNDSRLAQLHAANTDPSLGELNASGVAVDLCVYSLLRKGSGAIKGFNIVEGGTRYKVNDKVTILGEGYGFEGHVQEVNNTDPSHENNGSILDINITQRGYRYSSFAAVEINSSRGSGALLEPIFYEGILTLEANSTTSSNIPLRDKIIITTTSLQRLTPKEKWANLYLDTFFDRNDSWWNLDHDKDGLTNLQEYQLGTNPDNNDTDSDKLSDGDETSNPLTSNPLVNDTDGDGLSDHMEINVMSTNPRLQDTDLDGLLDPVDKFPNSKDGKGLLTGRIFKLSKYDSYKPTLYYRWASSEPISDLNWTNSWEFMEGFFNEKGLHYDQNYTIQAFLDMDDGGKDGNYTYGEPFAEVQHYLSEDFFGIRLTPEDEAPTIRLNSESTQLFDFNETNRTAEFSWGVEANDSFYDTNLYEPKLINPITESFDLSVRMGAEPQPDVKASVTLLLSVWGEQIDSIEYKYGGPSGISNWQTNGSVLQYTFYGDDSALNEMVKRSPKDSKWSLDTNNSQNLLLENSNENLGLIPFNKPNVYGLFGYDYEDNYGGEKISFLVEGNLSEYLVNDLSTPPSLGVIDYLNIPTGLWTLRYEAIDEHGNLSVSDANTSYVDLNITILDQTPPFFTLLDHTNHIGVTTFSIDELNKSDAISNNVLSYDLNESNGSVLWKGKFDDSFQLSDFNSDANTTLQLHVWDIKDGLIDNWNVSLEYNETDPQGNEDNIEFWKSIFADGNVTSLSVQQDENGVYSLPESTPAGVYRFAFQASDVANNNTSFFLFLLVDDTYVTTEITAVDGYLYNAEVIFDSNGDGISDLGRKFFTDENGRASISFTQEEFARFDLNGNGTLDSSEGKFIVIGGLDTSTGAYFPGKLIADANSSVISPLTTMIAKLMDEGASKSEAISALSIALQLNSEIDLTSYDPIQKAFEGDPLAIKVMEANLRMANLVNQAEGLLLTLSENYQGFSVGTYLLEEVAKRINLAGSSGIDLESALVDAIPIALASVGVTGELSLDDQLAMFQLIAEFDATLQGLEDELSFDDLLLRQKFIMQGFDSLFTDIEKDRDALELKYHTLELSSGMGGEVSQGGTYPYGSKVVITALPHEGYIFSGWEGDGVQNPNSKTTFVKIISDRNISATFAPKLHSINIISQTGGTAVGSGQYRHGQMVNLEAIASSGYRFSGWKENDMLLSTDNPLQKTVTHPVNLVAEFSPIRYSLTLNSEIGGTVLGQGEYDYGELILVQAKPDMGYTFSGWIGEGIASVLNPSTTVDMSSNRSLLATFTKDTEDLFRLELLANPFDGGTTIGGGTYRIGETISIAASPSEGFVFTGWSGVPDLSYDEGVAKIKIATDLEILANFSPLELFLNLEASNGGGVVGSGYYSYFDEVNITAVPDVGYQFEKWEGSGVKSPFSSSTKVFVGKATSLKAMFVKSKYRLDLLANEGGKVLGEGNFEYNTVATITAVPDVGFIFDRWTGDSISDNSSASTSVLVKKDLYLEANFVGIKNSFTPKAENFELWLDRADYAAGEVLARISAQDGDNDAITLNILSGNPDFNADEVGMFALSISGELSLTDPIEILQAAGSSIRLLISLGDGRGRSSTIEGIVSIAPRLILESKNLENGWFESAWFGTIYPTSQNWIYHYPMGWLYMHSVYPSGLWFWDGLNNSWIWTQNGVFPWFFKYETSAWIYHKLDDEEIKVFDQSEKLWKYRK